MSDLTEPIRRLLRMLRMHRFKTCLHQGKAKQSKLTRFREDKAPWVQRMLLRMVARRKGSAFSFVFKADGAKVSQG